MHTGENGLSKLSKSTRGNPNLCNWLDHVNSLYRDLRTVHDGGDQHSALWQYVY